MIPVHYYATLANKDTGLSYIPFLVAASKSTQDASVDSAVTSLSRIDGKSISFITY